MKEYYNCGECRKLYSKKDVVVIHGEHHCMGVSVVTIYCKDCWEKNKYRYDVSMRKGE